jgi:hypothetical protein
MRVREDDDRFNPTKDGVAELRVALRQKVPDGRGAGVDLFADAFASVTLRPPRVALATDVASETLRFDGHNTTGADQHVVDIATLDDGGATRWT